MEKQGRPKRTEWPLCKVEGCSKSTKGGAKGMCHTHYMAARRGRIDPVTGEELRPKKRVRSYGPGARCLVSNCGRRPKGRGLCTKHYQQWESGVNLGIKVPTVGHHREAASYRDTTCRVDGCEERPVNRWMCSKHAQQRAAGIINEDGKKLRDLKHNGRRPKDWRKELAGYILVRAPEDHPGARNDGSIYEHRLVMEEHLERFLYPEEVVHHINGVRDDNRIENLQLRRSRKEHGRGHEGIEDVDNALSVLERLVNKGMSDGQQIKRRLRSLGSRL